MCHVVPFITNAAILVSSITLVGIAMDRYFAVMRAVISFWNPGVIFCVLSMLSLWVAAIGASWPVFRVYELYPVKILTRQMIPIPDNTTIVSVDSATVTTTTTTAESGTAMSTLYETAAEAVTTKAWKQQTANNNQSYALLITTELVMMCISNQVSMRLICKRFDFCVCVRKNSGVRVALGRLCELCRLTPPCTRNAQSSSLLIAGTHVPHMYVCMDVCMLVEMYTQLSFCQRIRLTALISATDDKRGGHASTPDAILCENVRQ